MSDVFNFYVYDDRSIQFELAEPIMLEDKDVTQFRFRIPKSLNGFDMSDWEWWFIFVNPKGTKYTTLLELTDDEDEPDEYSVATYTVGYGFSGIVGTVKFSIEALYVEGESIINEWHTKTYSTTVTDTLQGHRAIIPEPDGQSSTGITEEVKQALLQIARKVAYIDEHGQTYYNALYDALYAITAVVITPKSISLTSIGATSQLSARTVPEGGTVAWSSSNPSVATVDQNGLVTSVAWGSATITATSGGKSGTCSVLVAEATLTEISAVYTPSGTVYESDSLDSLKSRLVVTAHWSNGTTSEVASADYTLSGTLQMGTSIITVSYGGMTDTFEVDVVGLTGVYAQYTQSGTVYDTDTLDSLKDDLYVYVSYSNMTTRDLTASEYTLSGTLAEGTSVVTVSYGGKTATFNVTVTHYSEPGKDWTSGVAYTVDWGEGGYAFNTDGSVKTSTNTSDHISSFLDCKGASAILCSVTPYDRFIYFYDENKTFILRQQIYTAIEDPLRCPVPRNAYYARVYERSATPDTITVTPYLYPTLTESTAYELDQYYVMEYDAGTDDSTGALYSHKGLCYGAKTMQTSMYMRSWIYFYDAETKQISNAIRQGNGDPITIPDGTYYIALYPNASNTNNPWVKFLT